MEQEEKQLLLKDLCGRLPYDLKVKCEKYPFPVTVLYAGNIDEVKFKETGGIENIYAIKPYLRPMSSMTEEEKKDFSSHIMNDKCDEDGVIIDVHDITSLQIYYYYFKDVIDWLLAHHFDYRGLIEKGLALEAPEDMYKTE